MGLFDRSKQVTETITNISNVSNTSTSNVQDSNNTITSVTSDFQQEIRDAFNTSASFTDQSVVSMPVAIQAGGASSSGFDLNKYFDSANSLAERPTAAQATTSIARYLVIAALLFAVFYFVIRKRKT